MEKIELFDEKGKSRGFYSRTNRINDLTGKEWVFWTRSVISKVYPPNLQHRLRSAHGGQKPPELCRDIISIFTKKGGSVLDPFMGVGGILLGAALCSRTATGIEIERKWIDIYSEVCKKENIPLLETIHGDATSVFDTFQGRNYDCIFTDVPYFTMDTAPRSRGKFKKTGEAAKEAPRSKLSRFNTIQYRTKEEWLNGMREIFEKAVRYLKSGGYCLVFIGDMYFRNEYHCLSAELAWELKKIAGLVWKANIIWYDVSKKLHLYGYQYAYIPSMIHQNIIILRKEL